jgi:hypothetical protein
VNHSRRIGRIFIGSDGELFALLTASAQEAADMLKKTFSALTVMAALGASALLPATASAQDRDHDRQQRERRLYDRTHRDYHNWNGDEDRLYREYLTAHHRRYLAFSRMNQKQQRAYWQWRHDHR